MEHLFTLETKLTLCKYFDEKYELIFKRLDDELDMSIALLGKMSMNEVRYGKIAAHSIFLNRMIKFSNEQNQTKSKIVLLKIEKNKIYFNSFLKHFCNF